MSNFVGSRPSFLRIFLSAGALLGAAALTSPAFAQNVTYTDLQASQGAAAFASECARCHGAQGQGAEGTALIGNQFDAVWRGEQAKVLFTYIKENMPADKAGTLKDADAIIYMAHILKLNGVPSGTQPLTANPAGIIPKK